MSAAASTARLFDLAGLPELLVKHPQGLPADLADRIRAAAALDGPATAEQAGKLIDRHGAEVRARQVREYEARTAAQQQARQQKQAERAEAWAALPRRERELRLLEEVSPATVADLLRLERELLDISNDELDELIPIAFQRLDGAADQPPALQRHRYARRLRAWKSLSPEGRKHAVLVDRAVRGMAVSETIALDVDEPPPRSWRP